jgi:hypothetical protein
MNLLDTSPEIAFDRRYPAEYRIGSYLARMACAMTEPLDEQRHQGVTDFFFGAQPSWCPMPFASDPLDGGVCALHQLSISLRTGKRDLSSGSDGGGPKHSRAPIV